MPCSREKAEHYSNSRREGAYGKNADLHVSAILDEEAELSVLGEEENLFFVLICFGAWNSGRSFFLTSWGVSEGGDLLRGKSISLHSWESQSKGNSPLRGLFHTFSCPRSGPWAGLVSARVPSKGQPQSHTYESDTIASICDHGPSEVSVSSSVKRDC